MTEQTNTVQVTQEDERAFYEVVEVLPTGAIRNLNAGLWAVLARHKLARLAQSTPADAQEEIEMAIFFANPDEPKWREELRDRVFASLSALPQPTEEVK